MHKFVLIAGIAACVLVAVFVSSMAALVIAAGIGFAIFVAWKRAGVVTKPGLKGDRPPAALAHTLPHFGANPGDSPGAPAEAHRVKERVDGYTPSDHTAHLPPQASGAALPGIREGLSAPAAVNGVVHWKKIAECVVFLALGVAVLGLLTDSIPRSMADPTWAIPVRLLDPVLIGVVAVATIFARRWYHLPIAWAATAFIAMLACAQVHFALNGGSRPIWPTATLLASGAWLVAFFVILIPFRRPKR